MLMGGRADGLACADPGVRTPIGASENFFQRCSGCDEEGYEDEGDCIWTEGQCKEIGDFVKNIKKD